MSSLKDLLERLSSIHNSTNNIGWGFSEYSPLMRTSCGKDTKCQFVIVVGHNFYKEVHTMFLEELHSGVYVLSVIEDNKIGAIVAMDSSEDVIVQKVIQKLKEWFPEKRSYS